MKRALLSVSDKRDIATLARGLADLGWEIVSTGGTARALRSAGLDVRGVSDLTGHPEIMDGRVKTLHPAVHSGLLARAQDDAQLAELGYERIHLVAVNLYPFRETVAAGDVAVGDAMEQVDIGGPTMLRAAAKNHARVWVTVDPADYPAVLEAAAAEDDDPELRRRLAAKVFDHVSGYDRAVADYLMGGGPVTLRYGENPDQAASFRPSGTAGLAGLRQLHGKALSYNNYLDLDGALLSLAPFAFQMDPAVVIVKHTTPCGLATSSTLTEAYDLALRTDPVSAFGSVIACSRAVDGDLAERMSSLFVECVVAPGFSDEALGILTRKKNLRLLEMPQETLTDAEREALLGRGDESDGGPAAAFLALHGRRPDGVVRRSVYGGVLEQSPPMPPFVGSLSEQWTVASERAPTAEEERDLRFAWAAVFGVKSNAILLARNGATLGIGAGQMSRVDASRLAVLKAGQASLDLTGCVLASDAFFPFRDGVDAAAEAGATAIVQPGGSIRDDEVVAAANEHGMAMVLTGRRLFRH